MQRRFDKRTELFMEFFVKELGCKFRDMDTGDLIGITDEGKLGVIEKGETKDGENTDGKE